MVVEGPVGGRTGRGVVAGMSDGRSGTVELLGGRYVRGRDGVWRYGRGGVPVVGARDVTLGDRYLPVGYGPERVIFSAAEVAQDPLLGWCVEVGQRVAVEAIARRRVAPTQRPHIPDDPVVVPRAEWERRRHALWGMDSPEVRLEDTPVGRLVQQAVRCERAVREAAAQRDRAVAARDDVICQLAVTMPVREIARELGLPRTTVARCLPASVARSAALSRLPVDDGAGGGAVGDGGGSAAAPGADVI